MMHHDRRRDGLRQLNAAFESTVTEAGVFGATIYLISTHCAFPPSCRELKHIEWGTIVWAREYGCSFCEEGC